MRQSQPLTKERMGIRPGLPLEVGDGPDGVRRAVQMLLDIEAGRAAPLAVPASHVSRTWGQPWLTAYLRGRRASPPPADRSRGAQDPVLQP